MNKKEIFIPNKERQNAPQRRADVPAYIENNITPEEAPAGFMAQQRRRGQAPTQTNVSVGTHRDTFYTPEQEEEWIDNNEDVDVDALQIRRMPQQRELAEDMLPVFIKSSNQENPSVIAPMKEKQFVKKQPKQIMNVDDAAVGEYIVVFRGQIVGAGYNLSGAEDVVASIFYGETKINDAIPDDFIILKRIGLNIGVNIKE